MYNLLFINYFLRKVKMRQLISQETLDELAKIKKAQEMLTRRLLEKSDINPVVSNPPLKKRDRSKRINFLFSLYFNGNREMR